MKILVRLLAVVILLSIIAVVALSLSLNSLTKKAVEKGGSYALGVPTTLEGAKIKPLEGQFALAGLTVANPDSFEAAHFFQLEEAQMNVEMGSLLSETIHADLFAVNGVELTLERRAGKTNYKAILEHLKKFESGGTPTGDSGGGAGKKIIVDEIVLEGVQVHADLLPAGGELTRKSITLPRIQLNDVGSEAGGLEIAELTGQILTAILKGASEAGAGLPADLLADLKGSLAGLEGNALELKGELASQAADIAGEAREAAAQQVEKIGEEAEDLLEEAGKKLDNLLKKP